MSSPSTSSPGRGCAASNFVNGARALPQPLQVGTGGPLSAVGSAASPTSLKTWDAPFANDVVTLAFRQSIGATDPLATGVYSKVVTLTLSTTTP